MLNEIIGFSKKRGFSKTAKEGLQKAITYFQNHHHHQMDYVEYKKQNFPIGSGITEVPVKLLLNKDCMSWNINSAQNVLNIRALRYSDGEWKQFWQNVDKHGFSMN